MGLLAALGHLCGRVNSTENTLGQGTAAAGHKKTNERISHSQSCYMMPYEILKNARPAINIQQQQKKEKKMKNIIYWNCLLFAAFWRLG